jgi:hypothetical protein
MNKHRNLSSGDWQLLSVYLDSQLSDKEKRQVDERLQSDPEYRQAMESLRHTSKLLSSVKVIKVPRNFTISPQSIPKKIIPSFIGILRFSSALAALLLVAAFALDFNQRVSSVAAIKVAGDLQPEVAMVEAAKSPVGGPPMIIFWGAPAPAMGFYGKGGGGGAEGSGLGKGGGPAQPDVTTNVAPPTVETPLVEAAPLAQAPTPEPTANPQPFAVGPQLQPTFTPEPGVQAAPVPQPQLQATPALEPLTGNGPVLGVQTPEAVGKAPPVVEVPLRRQPPQAAIPFRLIEIVLALLLVVIAVPAWLLKRK